MSCMTRRAAAALLLIVGALGSAPLPARAAAATIDIVGRNSLGNRGMNAALAIAGHCAWVGSRNDAPVQVLDIANPAAPSVVGALGGHRGSTPRELRALASTHLLVVMYYRLSSGLNGYDIYHWDSDCAAATLVGHWDFGGGSPHEFFLWQDPAQPSRVLLYTTMFATATLGLQVLDISVPSSPVLLGGWAVPAGYGHAPVHSVAVSEDGRSAYISLWTGGLVVADVADFAAGRAGPMVRPLTPAGSAYRTPPGNVHSAVPLEGGTRVLVTDERYPAPFGAGCPFGPAHVVDLRDPAHPVVVAILAVPENDPVACAAAPRGTWTSHNPTLTAHLAFITWYSAGLQVFDLTEPTQPLHLAELRPSGGSPAQRDLQLGVTDSLAWSYPVIFGGLVYIADINQGLLVLRYSGPHQDEVTASAFAEGNSNVRRTEATAAVALPSAPAHPAPTGRAATAAATAGARFGDAGEGGRLVTALVVLFGALGLAAAAAVAVARRRHRV